MTQRLPRSIQNLTVGPTLDLNFCGRQLERPGNGLVDRLTNGETYAVDCESELLPLVLKILYTQSQNTESSLSQLTILLPQLDARRSVVLRNTLQLARQLNISVQVIMPTPRSKVEQTFNELPMKPFLGTTTLDLQYTDGTTQLAGRPENVYPCTATLQPQSEGAAGSKPTEARVYLVPQKISSFVTQLAQQIEQVAAQHPDATSIHLTTFIPYDEASSDSESSEAMAPEPPAITQEILQRIKAGLHDKLGQRTASGSLKRAQTSANGTLSFKLQSGQKVSLEIPMPGLIYS